MNIDVKNLTKEEKLQLLKELFDNTNIVIAGSYGSETTACSSDIILVEQKNRRYYHDDNKECDYLIAIRTDICSG